MKDKFVITITDINGSRQFLLHQLIKKYTLYFIIFIFLVIVVGAFLISFLISETKTMEMKKDELVLQQETLNEKNEFLQKQIEEKTKEYEIIDDKISNIEELIGLKPSDIGNITDRLEAINLTGTQQQILFQQIPNGWVIPNAGVSASFGWRQHPIYKRKDFHQGIDLRAPLGTPVVAPADGVVETSSFNAQSGYGYLVILSHNYGFKTRFAHLQKKTVVKPGDFVSKGTVIGYTGNTGTSTGPHLHYEIRFVSRPLNPIYFLRWNSSNFEKIFEEEKRVPWQSLIKTMQNQGKHQKQQ